MATVENSIVLNTPAQIRHFHMCAQLAALKLEMAGLKHSKGSVYAHIKRVYGFRGNKQRVYTQFAEYIEKQKELL